MTFPAFSRPFLLLPLLLFSLVAGCGGGGGSASEADAEADTSDTRTVSFSLTPDASTAPAMVFVESGTGDAVSRSWELDGVRVGEGRSRWISVEEAGIHEIRLVETDGSGAEKVLSKPLVLEAGLPVSVSGKIVASRDMKADGDTPSTGPHANDTEGDAQSLTAPFLLGGVVGGSDPEDWYDITPGTFTSLRLAGTGVRFFLKPAGGTLFEVTTGQEAMDGSTRLLKVTGSGTYRIGLSAATEVAGVAPAAASETEDVVAGEIVVRFTDGRTRKVEHFDGDPDLRLALSADPQLKGVMALRDRVSGPLDGAATRSLAASMTALPEVVWAEPNRKRLPCLSPDDPFIGFQWALPAMNLPAAWEKTQGEGAIIAILDTGVKRDHPDISDRLVAGYDFVSNIDSAADGDGIDANPDDPGIMEDPDQAYHGTHVAGIAAATTNNGRGVAGVAGRAKIMPLRVIGKTGGSSYDLAQAIRFAAGLSNDSGTVPARRADILNLSLGGKGATRVEQDAIDAAVAAGVIVVAASGNEGVTTRFYPAAYDNVIAVTATGHENLRPEYANYGDWVDLAAPGGDFKRYGLMDGIFSTFVDPDGATYAHKQGTSMATPQVSGVLALMRSVNPELGHPHILSLLTEGRLTTDIRATGWDEESGWGLINAEKAVTEAGVPMGEGSVQAMESMPLDFGLFGETRLLHLANGGSAADFQVMEVTENEDWLSVTREASLPGEVWRVRVDRSRLPAAARVEATLFVWTTSGVGLVPVRVETPTGMTGEPGVPTVRFVNEETGASFDQVAVTWNGADGVYQWEARNLPPGTYRIEAETDLDRNPVTGSHEAVGRLGSLRIRDGEPDLDRVGLAIGFSETF